MFWRNLKNDSTLTNQICDGSNRNSCGALQTHPGPRKTYTDNEHRCQWALSSPSRWWGCTGFSLRVKTEPHDTLNSFVLCGEKQTSKRGKKDQVPRLPADSRVCSKAAPRDSRRSVLETHTGKSACLCSTALGLRDRVGAQESSCLSLSSSFRKSSFRKQFHSQDLHRVKMLPNNQSQRGIFKAKSKLLLF